MPTDSRRANSLAILILAVMAGAWHLANDPQASGTEPEEIRTAFAPSESLDLPPRPVAIDSQAPVASLQLLPENSNGVSVPSPVDSADLLSGKWALQLHIALLQDGIRSLREYPDYNCVFWKQERIEDELLDPQQVNMKIRHAPFSVYMKWTEGDKGRQLIYIDGQNDGNMLVQPGGLVGRATGTLELDPLGDRATSESRYHINKAGILNLAQTIIDCQNQELGSGARASYELRDNQSLVNPKAWDGVEDAPTEERPCFTFITTYANRSQSPLYSKSMIQIDKELKIPLTVLNYTWPEEGEAFAEGDDGVIEHYVFRQIELKREFTDEDFDRTNKKYRMR